jgi:hypothetical protein
MGASQSSQDSDAKPWVFKSQSLAGTITRYDPNAINNNFVTVKGGPGWSTPMPITNNFVTGGGVSGWSTPMQITNNFKPVGSISNVSAIPNVTSGVTI